MSMLAEPRRKQKWTLNPRGKQWSDDSSKFGQKMLEKMGWTNGKGLGANEQGMTEHVKVSYKNNQSGIGFEDKGDQWTQHQADFNDFLSQLQEQNSNSKIASETEITEPKESLESKSKQSRARVHYHKFTRGKDVKKYSPKDLANIFGKRDLKDAVKTPKAKETAEEITADPTGSKDNRGGVLTIKGGNIDEYFKNKLPNFVKKGISNDADESEGEYEPRLGFGFSSVEDESMASQKNSKQNKYAEIKGGDNDKTISGFAFANEGLDLDYQEKERDSKENNVGFSYDNPCLNLEKRKNVEKSTIPFSNEGFVNPALNLNDLIENGNNGAEFEVSRVELGLDNNALDLSDENSKKKRVTFNDKLEFNTDVVKKKKKRKGKDKLDKFEVDNSKLMKKAKEIPATVEFVSNSEVKGFVNEALEIEGIRDEINDNELNERKTKKSKRKKNRRLSSLETIEEIAEENSQINESEVGEAVLLDEASPKKKKKSKNNSEIGTHSELNADISTQVQIAAPETKKKDKKEKKIALREESVSEKKSDRKKGKTKKVEEPEITVLGEISRKIIKSKRNKVGDEPRSSDSQQEAIESVEGKKKDKKRFKLKVGEKIDNDEVESREADNEIDIAKSSNGTKRKSSSGENCVKLTKRSKLEDQTAAEDTENVEQNTDISVNSIPSTPCDQKDKKSKKTLKSFFAKAPILYFSGSNINDMPGYGAVVTAGKQD